MPVVQKAIKLMSGVLKTNSLLLRQALCCLSISYISQSTPLKSFDGRLPLALPSTFMYSPSYLGVRLKSASLLFCQPPNPASHKTRCFHPMRSLSSGLISPPSRLTTNFISSPPPPGNLHISCRLAFIIRNVIKVTPDWLEQNLRFLAPDLRFIR